MNLLVQCLQGRVELDHLQGLKVDADNAIEMIQEGDGEAGLCFAIGDHLQGDCDGAVHEVVADDLTT